ncbi:MAG: hypothetical protein WCW01_00370 [Gammaproteobacteria bacterium]
MPKQLNNDEIIRAVIPEHICQLIGQKYYNKIPTAVDFEHIIHSKTFLENPTDDIALFSDHGLNHVKNVAAQVPTILRCVQGIHIPKRSPTRLKFMEQYGIILGFIHDIGMSNVSAFGRAMHGEFVAQEVFMPNFEPIFKLLWEENIGNIPWLLSNLHSEKHLVEKPKVVFRELLALACCHRKQLVPVSVLNSASALQAKVQFFISNTLEHQYEDKKNPKNTPKTDKSNNKILKRLGLFYKNFPEASFSWLKSNDNKIQELIFDIVDTIRIVRCADGLRQRGTELKTSAQFQIFINQFTASAVYSLTSKDGRMYFLESEKSVNSGESNVANMYFTKEGDLRFSFHRGYFHSEEATERGLLSLQKLIIQLDNDISDTFSRIGLTNDKEKFKAHKRPSLLLETTEDRPKFTKRLVENIVKAKPELAKFIVQVPSLKLASPTEYSAYMNADSVTWNTKEKRSFLKKIAANGHKITQIDIEKAFTHSKIIQIKANASVFDAKTSPAFVYFPFSYGLEGYPTGSYSPFKVAPWTPLGSTGAIRGDIRNATVVAKKNVKLLMIPQEDYLQYWHAMYSVDEFVKAIKEKKIM